MGDCSFLIKNVCASMQFLKKKQVVLKGRGTLGGNDTWKIKTYRTINYAESYHKKKTTFGQTHLPLGAWVFHQRETQYYDDEKLNRVMKNYDSPPPANENVIEADFNIDEAKNQMDIDMEDPEYEQKTIFLYYSLKLGKLLGFKKKLQCCSV